MMVELDAVRWIHGSPDCGRSRDPLIQVHQLDEGAFVLRLSKCYSFEANFLYLFIGTERAVLFDTGAPPDAHAAGWALPLRPTVEAILDDHSRGRSEALELVVAHTHTHRDHVHWDGQFAGRPRTTLVGHGLEAVRAFWNLPGWPEGASLFDLGDRLLTVFAIPGHEASHIAIYDERTRLLLTGDTLYPGLLTVRDWPAFRASARRMAEFARRRPVLRALGNHVEMSRTPGVLYPLGTTYQPEEHRLALTADHIAELHNVCEAMAEAPRDVTRASFAIAIVTV